MSSPNGTAPPIGTVPRVGPDRSVRVGGVGLGWRAEIAPLVAALAHVGGDARAPRPVGVADPHGSAQDVGLLTVARPARQVDFVEVVAEAVHGPLREQGRGHELASYGDRGVPVLVHGVGLSLASADPADVGPATTLADPAALLGSPLVSEHLAFVRAGGVEAGHLLPPPRTREGVAVVARNVARVVAELPVPLALEMPATLLTWPEDTMSDAAFVTACLEATDCGLVLDIANVFANAVNTGGDPAAALEAYPLERIAYCHIAGGVWRDGVYLDTHTHPVLPEVLDLAEHLGRRCPGIPVLLERDGNYPAPAQVAAELAAVRARMVTSG